MTDPNLVFLTEGRAGPRLVVNFGVFSGREATEAEVFRLAQTLLEELDSVEIVSEHRYEFDADVEATVHQVCIAIPRSAEGREGELAEVVETWARDCIGERHITL
jgi:gamma-glutamylcyclotransferase (GGCT)/AIG2-like uncharacterized protein YtfP